jgi:hypothetical protein
LQQIGQRVDLASQLAQRVRRTGSARAEGVIALAQRGDDVGKRLQRAGHAFQQHGGNQQKIAEQANNEQNGWRQGYRMQPKQHGGKK